MVQLPPPRGGNRPDKRGEISRGGGMYDMVVVHGGVLQRKPLHADQSLLWVHTTVQIVHVEGNLNVLVPNSTPVSLPSWVMSSINKGF